MPEPEGPARPSSALVTESANEASVCLHPLLSKHGVRASMACPSVARARGMSVIATSWAGYACCSYIASLLDGYRLPWFVVFAQVCKTFMHISWFMWVCTVEQLEVEVIDAIGNLFAVMGVCNVAWAVILRQYKQPSPTVVAAAMLSDVALAIVGMLRVMLAARQRNMIRQSQRNVILVQPRSYAMDVGAEPSTPVPKRRT